VAKILVVDDLAANRDFLVTLLRYQKHDVLEAADGSEGLAVAKKTTPDLVITDVLMPSMDGYELLRQLREDPATARIPVIFYTAHYGEREARQLALSAGVSAVITKPAEPQTVLDIVARALGGAPPLPPSATASAEIDRAHLQLLTNKLSENVDGLRVANARLRALINIGLGIASERDMGALLKAVASAAQDLFSASCVTLAVFARDDYSRVDHVVTTAPDASWTAAAGRPSGVIERVVSGREVVRAVDRDGNPAAIGLPAGHPRVAAYLAAPLASPIHVYGWICLASDRPVSFTEEDEQLLAALAGLVGRVYANGYLAALAERRAAALYQERDRVQHLNRVYALLSDTNQTIVREADRQKLLEAVCRIAVETGGFRMACVSMADASARLLVPAASAGVVDGYVDEIEIDVRNPDYGSRPMLRAIVTGAHAICDDVERVSPGPPWRDRALRCGYRACAAFPLIVSGQTSGVYALFASEPGFFDADELRLLDEMASDISFALEVSEREAQRRKLEDQLRQSQKMEAMGQLAGGVAHDFNNLLGAILGYSELLLDDLDPDDPHRADITSIQKAATSAAAVTRQLLAFSRRQIVEPMLVDLSAVAGGMREMLTRLIGEDVRVVLDLQRNLPRIKIDPTQVEQVVLNLAVNARDAMPNGGTLTLSTSLVTRKEGQRVAITVADTGTGILPAIRHRLFEPFFTTKEMGKGTGLGLATVFGIAKQNGGGVDVDTEVGRGTAFTVYFPEADPAEAAAAAPPLEPRELRGTETVLVVEDNGGLRELTRRFLVKLGYTVLVAGSAPEALRICDRSVHIDLLLTDVVMPGGSGPDLASVMTAEHPGVKVVFMSGYTEEAIVHRGVLRPGIAFLHKPFSQEALGRKLREVIEHAS
jgi:signal transduction histidine kinase/DNA-binding response OmpR family regulator